MIRINLLPVRAAKKRELGKVQIALGVIVVVLAAGGNYLWSDSVETRLKGFKAQVANTKREIAQLEKIIGEVKDIQARKDDLKQKLAVLDELKKGKKGPVKVMDAMATLMPKEIWIRRFDEKVGQMSIDGSAMRHEDLGAFISGLKKSQYFDEVTLKSAKLKAVPAINGSVVEFKIVGKVSYTAG